LQLCFRLPKTGNHRQHALDVFNHTAHKVMMNAISYAHIQANNQHYKEVLHQKMNRKLGSSAIYLIDEQYCQVKISKSFAIQHLILIVTRCTSSIFVQVWIPWFKNHKQLEFCKLWSSSAFRALSEKKRLYRGKDLKHKYDTDGHVHMSLRMVRLCGSSSICMLSCD
jgi:hypothetical protein